MKRTKLLFSDALRQGPQPCQADGKIRQYFRGRFSEYSPPGRERNPVQACLAPGGSGAGTATVTGGKVRIVDCNYEFARLEAVDAILLPYEQVKAPGGVMICRQAEGKAGLYQIENWQELLFNGVFDTLFAQADYALPEEKEPAPREKLIHTVRRHFLGFFQYHIPVFLSACRISAVLYGLRPQRGHAQRAAASDQLVFSMPGGEPKYVLLMAVSILCGYGFGLLLERYRGGRAAKYICGISVGISLCFLLYFKYADFFFCRISMRLPARTFRSCILLCPSGSASIPSRSSAILWTCIGENPRKKIWFISRPISRCFPS